MPMRRLKTLWHMLNLPCRDVTRLASDSLDRDLGLLERFALKGHLVICVACRRYVRQIAFLRRALRQASPRIDAGRLFSEVRLPDEVRNRIKQALREL